MDNLNDLKKIWMAADTSVLPGSREMLETIRRYRSSRLIKKSALILAAALLTAIMVAVVFLYKSVMISTRLGEVCMIAASSLLVYTNLGSLARLYRVDNRANKEFLAYLQQVKKNRAFYYRKTQVAGMLLVSTGLLLYTYEGVHNSLVLMICSYSALIIYFAVLWFIIRPRTYRRQAVKLQKTIDHIHRLSNQY
jgi:hypothetical protein